jgi:hypothetical protein
LPVSINGRLITVDSMLFISWQVKFVSTPKGSVQTSNVHNIETKAQIFRCRRTFCSVSDVSMLKYKRYVHPRDVPNFPFFPHVMSYLCCCYELTRVVYKYNGIVEASTTSGTPALNY